MVMDKVVVRSPATLSNLGSGFDVFGLALREPYDEVGARRIPERKVVIEKIEGRGGASITTDPARNSAGVAAMAVLQKAGADFGVALTIKKGIRPSSGIGSSGASAAGGRLRHQPAAGEPAAAGGAGVLRGQGRADHLGKLPCR